MRKIVLCILAIILWTEVVDSLVCYNCRQKNCLRNTPCPTFMEKCITIILENSDLSNPKITKRCSTALICQIMNLVVQPVIRVICCDSDRCNH